MANTISEPVATGEPNKPAAAASLRVWPAVAIIAAYWTAEAVLLSSDMVISQTFMLRVGLWLLVPVLFLAWWLTRRQLRWSERLTPLAAVVVGAVLCSLVSMETLGVMSVLFLGLPLIWTAWTAWLLISRRASERTRRAGSIATILLVWAVISLLRVDGIDGRMMPGLHWR
jgi:hypothetical protein